MNFEQSMQELETIVKSLEAGERPIEESIDSFKKGIELVKGCRKLLEDAQKQVADLIGEISNEKTED